MNFISKFALSMSIGIVVAIFTAKAVAADETSVFYRAPCDDVAEMAKGIMDLRQMRYPKSQLTSQLTMNPLTTVVLENAYEFPIMPSDRKDLAKQLSRDYKNLIKNLCWEANAI